MPGGITRRASDRLGNRTGPQTGRVNVDIESGWTCLNSVVGSCARDALDLLSRKAALGLRKVADNAVGLGNGANG